MKFVSWSLAFKENWRYFEGKMNFENNFREILSFEDIIGTVEKVCKNETYILSFQDMIIPTQLRTYIDVIYSPSEYDCFILLSQHFLSICKDFLSYFLFSPSIQKNAFPPPLSSTLCMPIFVVLFHKKHSFLVEIFLGF